MGAQQCKLGRGVNTRSNVPRWIIALNGNKLWDVREIEALWSWHKLLASKSHTNHVKTLTARKKVNSRKT